ncbi:MAG: SDR family NAD(P)-dependent oxidoreductase [Magnetococcales bacterium]|nr:SDR family NAD(P)-dependent oxidoreductase [Magnetococcales bacterium]
MATVMITGVSSGLGFGLAKRALESGWSVLGLSRRTPDALIQHPLFRFVAVDLAQRAATMEAVTSLIRATAHLDLVLLNAGILGEIADMRQQSQETLEEVMTVNVWANKSVLDALIDADISMDQVVAISSGAAVNGNRGWGGYSISKAALNMMIRLYAWELPDTHVTALAPGLIRTDMTEHLMNEVDTEQFTSANALRLAQREGRMPEPEQAADLLLASFDRLRRYESGSFLDIRSL